MHFLHGLGSVLEPCVASPEDPFRDGSKTGFPAAFLRLYIGTVTFTRFHCSATVIRPMGNVRKAERRREARFPANLAVTVWGVDTKGERFIQEARARDISLSGALLSGLDAELRSGDVVGVMCCGKKARYRVVWLRHSDGEEKIQAAVQRFEMDTCPWIDALVDEISSEEAENVRFPSDWS